MRMLRFLDVRGEISGPGEIVGKADKSSVTRVTSRGVKSQVPDPPQQAHIRTYRLGCVHRDRDEAWVR